MPIYIDIIEEPSITLDVEIEPPIYLEPVSGLVQGPAGRITVGTVSTGAEGTDVIITNIGDATNAILDITIPRGYKGDDFVYSDFTVEQLLALTGPSGYTPIKGVDYIDGLDGDPGYTPIKGVDYFDGNDGYTPIKGVDYNDGAPGDPFEYSDFTVEQLADLRVGNTTGNTAGNTTGNTVGNTDNNTAGNTTGNITGNITGNTEGNQEGNTEGNTVGNTEGNTIGNTVGNTVGNTEGNTTGNTTGNTVGTAQWKGLWSTGAYLLNDGVSHNGTSYVANKNTSAEPPHADWDIAAAKGEQGEGIDTGTSTAIQKGDGSGGIEDAVENIDYLQGMITDSDGIVKIVTDGLISRPTCPKFNANFIGSNPVTYYYCAVYLTSSGGIDYRTTLSNEGDFQQGDSTTSFLLEFGEEIPIGLSMLLFRGLVSGIYTEQISYIGEDIVYPDSWQPFDFSSFMTLPIAYRSYLSKAAQSDIEAILTGEISSHSHAAPAGLHTQNTDTGTTGSDFTVDSDSALGKIKLSVVAGAVDKTLTVNNEALTDNRTLTLPNKTGTVAVTGDIPATLSKASSADINTGTDDAKYLTADGLAGSNTGCRVCAVQVLSGTTALAVANGKAYIRIPVAMTGMNLISCAAQVVVKSTSGLPTIMLTRGRQATPTSDFTYVAMLSVGITIDANEYDSSTATTAYTIDTSNDDILTGDVIRIDITGAGTGATGLGVTMIFQLP